MSDNREKILAEMEQSVTLTDGKVLHAGNTCLAIHPTTRRFRSVTIVSLLRGTGVSRAIVRDSAGEEWIAGRYALRAWEVSE